MTCAAYVSDEGKGFSGQLGISRDAHLPGLQRLAAGLREAGTVSSAQLQRSGMRASRSLTGIVPVCPWDDEKTGARALTTAAEVRRIVDDFVASAVRAQKAGFEGVELPWRHGYLLGQFLDADNNRRDDGYGGSLEERARILFEVIEGAAAVDGAGLPAGPAAVAGALGHPDRRVTRARSPGGCWPRNGWSTWTCRCGTASSPARTSMGTPLIDLFAALPRGDTRLGVAGKLLSSASAQACLDRGADFVLIGRAAILHEDFRRGQSPIRTSCRCPDP
jgi:2,4-dienoyl-CoA reductase-like NADH-dependent reductase (Old Yellow Enzyme family)